MEDVRVDTAIISDHDMINEIDNHLESEENDLIDSDDQLGVRENSKVVSNEMSKRRVFPESTPKGVRKPPSCNMLMRFDDPK